MPRDESETHLLQFARQDVDDPLLLRFVRIDELLLFDARRTRRRKPSGWWGKRHDPVSIMEMENGN